MTKESWRWVLALGALVLAGCVPHVDEGSIPAGKTWYFVGEHAVEVQSDYRTHERFLYREEHNDGTATEHYLTTHITEHHARRGGFQRPPRAAVQPAPPPDRLTPPVDAAGRPFRPLSELP
jgi:hypothetical protein